MCPGGKILPSACASDVPHDTMEELHLKQLIHIDAKSRHQCMHSGLIACTWLLSDQQSSEHSSADQEIKKCFKAGSSNQGPNLVIKNFDRHRRWKYRACCGD